VILAAVVDRGVFDVGSADGRLSALE